MKCCQFSCAGIVALAMSIGCANADDKTAAPVDAKAARQVVAPAGEEKPLDVKLEPLFNGKDLEGFNVPRENPWWKVVDGVLLGQSDAAKKGHILYTTAKYKDLVIESDVRFADNIDSGFFVRKPELQFQLGVSRSLKVDMTGSIYARRKTDAKAGYIGKAVGVEKLLKLNQWNTLRMEVKGNTFKSFLNGQHVLTFVADDFAEEGPIGLQIHPGVDMKVEFKNMKVGKIE